MIINKPTGGTDPLFKIFFIGLKKDGACSFNAKKKGMPFGMFGSFIEII